MLCELLEKGLEQNQLTPALALQQTPIAKSNGNSMNYSRLFSMNDPRNQK
jgi:hypothetical protein